MSLAGNLLVARPRLVDPFFAQTVILLLQHGQEGAFGLILNKPVQGDELPFPMFVGGPCKIEGLLMLHGEEEWNEGPGEEGQVLPGVWLGNAECAEKATSNPLGETYRFRIFTGYAGWGPSQLEKEMVEGSWMVVPARSQHIFDWPVEELWMRLAPPNLPEPSVN